MRTTINLDGHLLGELKQVASRTNRTLTAVIEDTLRSGLAAVSTPPRGRTTKLPVSKCTGGLRPGVDIDNTGALLDLLNENDAAA